MHVHDFKDVGGNTLVCECGKTKLKIEATENEGLFVGMRKNGLKYTIRKHRLAFLYPDDWVELVKCISKRARLTFELLMFTGARFHEIENIRKKDIDFDRGIIVLQTTKRKARKAGEERGKPRAIKVSSEFIKKLKLIMKDKPEDAKFDLLTISGANKTLKNRLREIGRPDWFMFSVHNLRKTHGNWLSALSHNRYINCDANEICLRLGHDYNTFLRSYASPSIWTRQDIDKMKKIMGDLYEYHY